MTNESASADQVSVVDDDGRVYVGLLLAGKHVRVEVSRDGLFLRFVDPPTGDAWWIKEPEKLRRALNWGDTASPIADAVAHVVVEPTAQAKPKAKAKKRKRKQKQK